MIERDGGIAYETVKELLDRSEIADIVIYENCARRTDAEDSGLELQVLTRINDRTFEIRCRAAVIGHGGQYTADAGAIFEFTTEGTIEIEDALAREFAERVGVMTVYPYLRAVVGQSAASLGLDRPVLPLLRAGAVKLANDNAANDNPTKNPTKNKSAKRKPAKN